MSRFKDFDTAMAEAAGEPLVFVVGGEKFTLPPELPAVVPLSVMALRTELGDDAELPAENVLKLIRGVLGTETDRLLATGVSMAKLEEILTWVMNEYGGAPEVAADETQ